MIVEGKAVSEESVFEYKGLPEPLLKRDLRGNIRYPQMYSGKVIYTGEKAYAMLSAGTLTWDQFVTAEMSDEQIDFSADVVTKVHTKYGIPWLPEPENGEHIEGMHYFPRSHLQHLWKTATRKGAITATANYAGWVVDGIKTDVLETWIHMSVDSPSPFIAEITGSFLKDPQYQKERYVFTSMWQTAVGVLESPNGVTVGKLLRNSFARLHDPNEPDTLDTLRGEWDMLSDIISTYLRIELNEQKAFYEWVTGRDFPQEVINRFIRNLTSRVSQQTGERNTT